MHKDEGVAGWQYGRMANNPFLESGEQLTCVAALRAGLAKNFSHDATSLASLERKDYKSLFGHIPRTSGAAGCGEEVVGGSDSFCFLA